MLCHKTEVFWCLIFCHWSSSKALRAKYSHLQYQLQFCWLLWLLHINQDAKGRDWVSCMRNCWNGVKFLFSTWNCWTLEHRHCWHNLLGAHTEWAHLMGSSPRNFKFSSHIHSGLCFSHFSIVRYQFPCNILNRFFVNSCICCITQEKSLMHIAISVILNRDEFLSLCHCKGKSSSLDSWYYIQKCYIMTKKIR